MRLLFPRRLCIERGFRILVEAFDELLPRYPQLDLQLCGTGPADDEAIARAFVARHPRQVRWAQPDMDAMPASTPPATLCSCRRSPRKARRFRASKRWPPAMRSSPRRSADCRTWSSMATTGSSCAGCTRLADAVERLIDDRALAHRLAQRAFPSFLRSLTSAGRALVVAAVRAFGVVTGPHASLPREGISIPAFTGRTETRANATRHWRARKRATTKQDRACRTVVRRSRARVARR